MRRVAGDDLEWVDVDSTMLREMANDQVQMAVLSGVGADGRPFIFRLPVEKLRRVARPRYRPQRKDSPE